MGFIKEFKEFAMKGNVMDMAVGVIIGGAFGKIGSAGGHMILSSRSLSPKRWIRQRRFSIRLCETSDTSICEPATSPMTPSRRLRGRCRIVL